MISPFQSFFPCFSESLACCMMHTICSSVSVYGAAAAFTKHESVGGVGAQARREIFPIHVMSFDLDLRSGGPLQSQKKKKKKKKRQIRPGPCRCCTSWYHDVRGRGVPTKKCTVLYFGCNWVAMFSTVAPQARAFALGRYADTRGRSTWTPRY